MTTIGLLLQEQNARQLGRDAEGAAKDVGNKAEVRRFTFVFVLLLFGSRLPKVPPTCCVLLNVRVGPARGACASALSYPVDALPLDSALVCRALHATPETMRKMPPTRCVAFWLSSLHA